MPGTRSLPGAGYIQGRVLTSSEGTPLVLTSTGFPLGLENLEKWAGIFRSGKSQGILTRLEKSGKITQNTGKLREFQTNIICYSSVTAKLICVLFAKFDQDFSLKKNH